MKNKNFKRISPIFFVLLICIGTVLVWNTKISQGTTSQEAFNQSVNNALAEINLPSSNNLAEISLAADNLSNFISYRSGVNLNQTNRAFLLDNEQKAWSQSKRITKLQLAGILKDIAMYKVANITESQTNGMAQSLSGFYSPDLPAGFKNGEPTIMLRSDGRGMMSVLEFNNKIGLMSGRGANNFFTQDLIQNSIAVEIQAKIDILTKADSSFFDNSNEEMTPLQAMLIAYAVVADDNISGNQSDLYQSMQSFQNGVAQLKGSYPSPQGHRAFGENGYLFSTPTNILMDDSAITMFLEKVKEKGGLQ